MRLSQIRQKDAETVEKFSFRVEDAVTRTCVTGSDKEFALITTLVNGLNEKLRHELLKTDNSQDFNYRQCVSIAGKHEYIFDKGERDSPRQTCATAEIQPTISTGYSSSDACQLCGGADHSAPACSRIVVCQLCSSIGHTADVCVQLRNKIATVCEQGRDFANSVCKQRPLDCTITVVDDAACNHSRDFNRDIATVREHGRAIATTVCEERPGDYAVTVDDQRKAQFDTVCAQSHDIEKTATFRSDMICFECGGKGHFAREYASRIIPSNRNNPSGATQFQATSPASEQEQFEFQQRHIRWIGNNRDRFNRAAVSPRNHEPVNSVGWKHILVEGSCQNQRCFYFIDSGSAVTMVSTGVVRRLGLDRKIRPSNKKLISFSQDAIQTQGEITLEVSVAGSKFQHDFIVTDLLDTDFLIGDDFLRNNKILLDYERCQLRLPSGNSTPFKDKPRNVEKALKIRCARTTIVPPNSIQYLNCKIPSTSVDLQGITEPYRSTTVKKGLLCAEAVIHSERRWVPVKCINLSDEPITVYKNKLLAFLTPLGDHQSFHGVKCVGLEQHTDMTVGAIHGPDSNDWRNRTYEELPSGEHSSWTKDDLFEKLNLDKIDIKITDEEKNQLQDILWRHRSCFSRDEFDIGRCNMYEADIQLKEGTSPSWNQPIPTPYKLRPEMDKQIDEMLRAGVVEPLSEPSEFNSPIFLVKKNTPNSWRLVADMRGVNKCCTDDRFPLPDLNHVLDTIGSDSIYSVFDLSKSFWQIPVSEESKKVTAFLHRSKSYCFARLIMGHKNSSSKFSRVMQKLLATVPIEQLIFFIDDLFLSSSTVDQHLSRLEVLLQRLSSANLKLSPKKCELLRKEVTFVGVSVSGDRGVRITDDRVKSLQSLPEPTSVKTVQEVLVAFNMCESGYPGFLR